MVMMDCQYGDAEDFEQVTCRVVNHHWYVIETLARFAVQLQNSASPNSGITAKTGTMPEIYVYLCLLPCDRK